MLDNPELIKSAWGFMFTAIASITGVGYRKIKKIDADIANRPTHEDVKSLIESKLEGINVKQDYTIKKLEDVHNDVNRLEDIILRGKHDKE